MKIIFHEDLLRSSGSVVRDLLEFLGVPPVPPEVTKMHKVSGYPLIKPLQSFLLKENRLKTSIKGLIGEKRRLSIKEALLAANMRTKKIPRADLEYLRARFDQDVARLQELLQVDLSHWLADRPTDGVSP